MSLGGLISTWVWYIGFATLAVGLRRLASFLHIYTLHSSTVQRYLADDDKAFALVTGASDGLGKELVKDLYERGVRSFMEQYTPTTAGASAVSCASILGDASSFIYSIISCCMVGTPRSLKPFARNCSHLRRQNVKSNSSSPTPWSIRAGTSHPSRGLSSLLSSS